MKLKKKLLALLSAAVFLFGGTMAVYAATAVSASDFEVVVKTDKETYAEGEDILLAFAVVNNSKANVLQTTFTYDIPEVLEEAIVGYDLLPTVYSNLSAGNTLVWAEGATVKSDDNQSADAIIDSVVDWATGDTSAVWFWIAIMVVSAIVFIALVDKKALKKMFGSTMAVVMLVTTIFGANATVMAATKTVDINGKKTITYAGEEMVISIDVALDVEEEADIQPEDTQKPDTENASTETGSDTEDINTETESDTEDVSTEEADTNTEGVNTEEPDTNTEDVNTEEPDTNTEDVNTEEPDTNTEDVNTEEPDTNTETESEDTESEEPDTDSDVITNRVSVHDPSIIKDPKTGMYYVFGSHMAWAKSEDLMNWTLFRNNINTNYKTLFAEAIEWSALGGTQGSTTGAYDVSGNLWAPDVIYNEAMGKWCMYMSVNGDDWYSSIVLLTADSLEGNWTYVDTVVYSGFTNADEAAKTDFYDVYKGTDFPSRYTQYRNGNQTYGMNCIDPCVFYDEEGTLWMTYGSWFGGIYMIELDEATGLRDYTHTYETVSETSDEYQGILIAGGNNVSGEASYIEYIDGQYHLFMSYGALTAPGGYNMRVFVSDEVTGPYVDYSGNDARYLASSNTGVGKINGDVGVKLMTYYKWSHMAVGQVAQGHNSAFVDEDGRAYLVYHTRTNDGTEGHQVRVHQLFTNEEGWLVTAPYEFRGEIVDKNGYDTSAIVGTYDVIVHKQSINYASLSCVTPETIQLKADGTVTGAYTGTWSVTEGTPYITIKLGNMTVKGVLVEQYVEDTVYKTMCFTGLSNTEVQVWGSKWLPAKEAVELTISTEYVKIPTSTMSDITFETEGLFGTTLTYASSNTDVLANDGTINRATEDTVVTVTVTYINGDYQDTVEYDITIVGKGEAGDRVLIAEYYTNEKINISGATEGKYQVANPFNSSVTNGLEIYNGVSIEFDVEGTGSALSNILAFYGSGRLYFTGGSYLGYNATGGYYDANLTSSYGLANDFIKGSAHIRIDLDATGYYVYANDELAYSNADVAAGTIPGSGDLTVYANVLKWLNTTAETLNFGWGNWWTDSFNGTISNVKLYANAIEEVDTSGYEYYQDYNKGLIEEWSSTNASGNLAVGNDGDAHSNYFKFSFAGDSSTNSRGAIAAFATDNAITGNYHIEMDVMLNAGNNQETQFAITTEGYAYTGNVINNGIDSGYILKLSATNSTTWSIAGTDGGTVILPDNAWVTISMDVDTEAGVAAVVISDGENVLYEGQVTMSGNGALKGIYIRAGRYQAEAAVDNIKVSYME